MQALKSSPENGLRKERDVTGKGVIYAGRGGDLWTEGFPLN